MEERKRGGGREGKIRCFRLCYIIANFSVEVVMVVVIKAMCMDRYTSSGI